MRKYEIELRAVDGMGLSEVQMDLLVTLLDGFVRGAVGGTAQTATQDGGAAGRSPTPSRSSTRTASPPPPGSPGAPGRTPPDAAAPDRSFEFGLERLLDGIGVLMLNPSR